MLIEFQLMTQELDDEEDVKSFGLLIDAIKKQIPMQPLHEHKNYYCPVCRENGWMLWDDAIPNDMDSFCGKCGQAIDWSVSE